jgi:hypothetical protein
MKTLNLWQMSEGNPPLALLNLILSPMKRKFRIWFSKDPIVAHRRERKLLRVAMLPFEEQHSVDAGRLEKCKSVFPYEDEKGEIRTIPACMWPPYRDVVLKVVAKKWGAVDKSGKALEKVFGVTTDDVAAAPPQ